MSQMVAIRRSSPLRRYHTLCLRICDHHHHSHWRTQRILGGEEERPDACPPSLPLLLPSLRFSCAEPVKT
eukprot:c44999_g1_i1 orf=3-209(-)